MSAFLLSAWDTLADASVYLLAGFLVAGLLEGVLASRRLLASIEGARTKSVVLATLLGVPLPLCSCSVLPTAITLRRRGAGKGATVAFLIATPETSVTSILLTYGLLGPLFAVVRPVAATFTALGAGLVENALERRDEVHGTQRQDAPHAAAHSDRDCCAIGAPQPSLEEPTVAEPAAIDTCCGAGCDTSADVDAPAGLTTRLRRGMRFAFVDLFDDIFGWLVIGVLAAAAIQHVVPPALWTSIPGGSFGAMLAMVVVGVPLYICAEASTPVAAALVANGLSPGAALVLLLVGPATNLGALGVLRRELGLRSVVSYLATIIVVALLTGLLLDGALGTSALALGGTHTHGGGTGWMDLAGDLGAVALLLLGLGTLARKPWVRRFSGAGGARDAATQTG